MKTLSSISKMSGFDALCKVKALVVTGVAIVSVSHFITVLFGQTIPNVVWSFFKEATGSLIVAAVFLFAIMWFLKARPQHRPKKYNVISYDVFGKESVIDGLRMEFKNHDVAWSFMKQYKSLYPLYNFALVSDLPHSNRKTIFRYI